MEQGEQVLLAQASRDDRIPKWEHEYSLDLS